MINFEIETNIINLIGFYKKNLEKIWNIILIVLNLKFINLRNICLFVIRLFT